MAADLKAEVFAELVKLMQDIRRGQAAMLLELRAVRMSLTDTETDNPTAVATAKKAEGETISAIAGEGDVLERLMKKKLSKEFGVDLTNPNLDEAALEALLDGRLAPGSPGTPPK